MSEVLQHSSCSTPSIHLTESALQRFLKLLHEQANCSGVRLSVKKTGCSGLSYVIDYVKEPIASDINLPLAEPFCLYIDKVSYPYLNGMQIDYVKQGLNQKFVFNNPNQTGQCGCGESFTVD